MCDTCEILKAELEDAKADLYRAVSANGLYSQQASNLERQLAEARAENERLNSVDHYACALCPDVAQARQEAAREILTEIEKYYVGGKHDYYHITTEDLIGMIKAKFRLEG